MKKRFSLIVVSGIIMGVLFSSISAFAFDESSNVISSDTNKQDRIYEKQLGNMVMGKVTAIDGNNITIVKALKPEVPEENGEKPDRQPPESGERPERPEINGEKPDKELTEEELENMKANKKNRKNEMEFTGDEITITIDDESIIKLMEMKFKMNKDNLDIDDKTDERKTGSIEDIEIGSVINILYSDESDTSEIKEIMIKKFDNIIQDTTATGSAI